MTHLFAFGSSSLSLGGIASLSLFPRKTWLCCWTARRRWPALCPGATTPRWTPTASRCSEPDCWMRRFSRWGRSHREELLFDLHPVMTVWWCDEAAAHGFVNLFCFTLHRETSSNCWSPPTPRLPTTSVSTTAQTVTPLCPRPRLRTPTHTWVTPAQHEFIHSVTPATCSPLPKWLIKYNIISHRAPVQLHSFIKPSAPLHQSWICGLGFPFCGT